MFRPPHTLPALVALALVATTGTAVAAAKPRYAGCWPVAAGAWLELRVHDRGTPAPLVLHVERQSRKGSFDCREAADSVGRMAPVADPLPEPLRVEWQAVREWRARATAHWMNADSTLLVPEAPVPARLAGTGGSLTLTRRPARYEVPDSIAIRLEVGDRVRELTMSPAQAWNFVWTLGEQSNVLDPEGRVDFEGALEPAQVEKPATPVPTPACEMKEREWVATLTRDGYMRDGVVRIRFVVSTLGRLEDPTLEVLHSDANRDMTLVVRDIVACYNHRPARLRGRAVRQVTTWNFFFGPAARRAENVRRRYS